MAHAVVSLQHRRHVRQHRRDGVAPADAVGGEGSGEPARAREKIPMRDAASPWTIAIRSGWIAAVRGKNVSGDSAVKFSGLIPAHLARQAAAIVVSPHHDVARRRLHMPIRDARSALHCTGARSCRRLAERPPSRPSPIFVARGRARVNRSSAVVEEILHHAATGTTEPRFTSVPFTMVIDKQDGRRFSGTFSSAREHGDRGTSGSCREPARST